jgi:hypothetical protein
MDDSCLGQTNDVEIGEASVIIKLKLLNPEISNVSIRDLAEPLRRVPLNNSKRLFHCMLWSLQIHIREIMLSNSLLFLTVL